MIQGDIINLGNVGTSEYFIRCFENGSVQLRYDNSTKLETISTGALITGDGHELRFKSSNAYSGGTISFYDHNSSSSDGRVQYEHSTNAFLFETGGSWRLRLESGQLRPETDNAYDLGTASKRFRNLYTTDLQLSNKGKSNDVDGTWGNYTIQEGESDLFLINNRSGKKYKFNLTEVS